MIDANAFEGDKFAVNLRRKESSGKSLALQMFLYQLEPSAFNLDWTFLSDSFGLSGEDLSVTSLLAERLCTHLRKPTAL